MATFTLITAIAALTFSRTISAQGPLTVLNPGFGFGYVGCYNEVLPDRALAGAELDSTQQNVTIEICAQFCSSYRFMGVEYGTQCFCADLVAPSSHEVTTESGLTCEDPTYACVGNANEQCGGSGTLDLYAQAGATTTAYVPAATGFTYVMDSFIVNSVNGTSGEYNYIGCYNDPGATTRALTGTSTMFGAQTVEGCANFCAGYTYFGLEDGGECYCGNAIENGASLVNCQSECYQCCADDLTERCGGYYVLSMYELNGPNFTNPNPAAVCTYNGPATAIVTAGSTMSYYGPITTGSVATPYVTVNSQGSTTSFTSTEFYCEGGCMTNPHTPGGNVTATHYPSMFPPMPTPTPTALPNVAGCGYLGCYDDNGGGRALNYQQTQLNSSTMTQELCVDTCLGAGYPYAGVEYGSQCFCGSSITAPHAMVQPGEVTNSGITLTCTDPSYACSGNDAEQCGGFATINIWFCPQNAQTNSMTPSSGMPSMSVPPSSSINYNFSNNGAGRSGTLGTSSVASSSISTQRSGSMTVPSLSSSMSSMLHSGSMIMSAQMSSSGSTQSSTCQIRTTVLPYTRS